MNTMYEKLDSEARACFDSLPAFLQEQIMQSGIELTTKAQLESYCKNALQKDEK